MVDDVTTLGIALVVSSSTPLILLNEDLTVKAASGSFCRQFGINPGSIVGASMFDLGSGEWDVPQLRSLLNAARSTKSGIEGYELDLKRNGEDCRNLVLSAHALQYNGAESPIVLAIADVTSARQSEQRTDRLIHEKDLLHQEMQHRVANSLQIIASVLMQSARRVQSQETRAYLRDAHHRVLSVAQLQRQLAVTNQSSVALGAYIADLCASIGASMIDDPKRIRLTSTVDDTVTSPDVSVSLGLIVTELVMNALKHAFPDDTKRGNIVVDFKSDGPNWTLRVSDDGIGISTGGQVDTPGLGTGIVEALAKQLAAKVTVVTGHSGTNILIVGNHPVPRTAL